MRALLFLAYASIVVGCGEEKAPPPPPAPLPPNTEAACQRAIQCGTIAAEQYGACAECLEHIDQNVLAELEEMYGEIPPLETVACELVTIVAREATDIGDCIDYCAANTCVWENQQ